MNAQDGTQKSTTEVIISDMILLDSYGKRSEAPSESEAVSAESSGEPKEEEPKKKSSSIKAKKTEEASDQEVAPDDIPF